MKKLWAAMAAGLILAAPGAAMAMDSATLLENPSQYRVIYADGKKAVYADMATVNAVQSRDLHASIEKISFTMYVENYVKNPDAMAYQTGDTVADIQQYEAVAYGNKNADRYRLETKLTAVYDADGREIGGPSWKGKKVNLDADDLYYSLFRAVHAPKAE